MRDEQVAAAAALLGPLAQREWPLGLHTTYRVGGNAAIYVEAASEEELSAVHEAVEASGLPVLVLGRGSNLLVGDAGFSGIVVSLGEGFTRVELDGEIVRAGGGASYPVVARSCARAGLAGMEWAVGVPGSVGGAVRMNAGGHGSETSEVLREARVLDLRSGSWADLPARDLDLSYRHSCVGADQVVVSASFELQRGDRQRSEDHISEIVRWRRQNQPGGQNAGSVFTNPPGDSAGRLVEAAGAKGLRLGSAMVSEKHANFIQADPQGSADDVMALIEEVRDLVAERTGTRLELEVRLVAGGALVEPAR